MPYNAVEEQSQHLENVCFDRKINFAFQSFGLFRWCVRSYNTKHTSSLGSRTEQIQFTNAKEDDHLLSRLQGCNFISSSTELTTDTRQLEDVVCISN